jgi:hypothetical protein
VGEASVKGTSMSVDSSPSPRESADPHPARHVTDATRGGFNVMNHASAVSM